jgi:GT2 family glycosyltransferase
VEKNQGLSHARNRAVKEAKSKWIAFLDDDAIASPDWLSKIFQFQEEHPDIKIFGGPYSPYFPKKKPIWLSPQLCMNDYGPDCFDIEGTRCYISGGNMILHRDVFEKVGLFNVSLGMQGNHPGWGEESEWFSRAEDKGWKIFYAGTVSIAHLVHPKKNSLLWQLRTQIDRGAFSQQSYPRRGQVRFPYVVFRFLLFFLKSFFLIFKKALFFKKTHVVEEIFTQFFFWLQILGRYLYCQKRHDRTNHISTLTPSRDKRLLKDDAA